MKFAALGLLTGLLFGLPLGPTGALCAQRCREEGWQQGVLTALGASAADGVYAALALGLFWGLWSFQNIHRQALLLVGSCLFLALGVRSLLWPREELSPDWEEHSVSENFGAGLVVGFSIPGALLRFAAARVFWNLPPMGWGGFLWPVVVACGCLAGHLAAMWLTGVSQVPLRKAERFWGGWYCAAFLGFILRAVL